MKKRLFVVAVAVICAALATATGEGVTLRTASIFAGMDAGAQAYVDILAAWEAETGNKVEDASATSDEAWKAAILNDFAAGNEPDVFFYFAGGSDSQPILYKVVPIAEINAAYPALNLPEAEALREADGNVYAIPVRSFWEGLFCNLDLFEQFGLDLPTDAARFERAVSVFNENGVIPLAISLSDIPHYLAEFAILSVGTVADHRARPKTAREMPASWAEGMGLIARLYEIGAFPENVNATSEDLTTAMFLGKEAAMLLDGSWRANGITQEHWDSTVLVPFPAYGAEADPTAIIGGTSMGFYLSRRAWEDVSKRDAAVSLLARLTSDESKEVLGYTFGGEMLRTAQIMVDNANANGSLSGPFQDAMDPEVRSYWFSQIPLIAEGAADPAGVMAEVIGRGAF